MVMASEMGEGMTVWHPTFLMGQWFAVASRGGGQGGGASAPGPEPVVGARAKLDLFLFLLIGSQWGIQDFDKGGPPKNHFGLATLDMIWLWLYYAYTHTNTHTHTQLSHIHDGVYYSQFVPYCNLIYVTTSTCEGRFSSVPWAGVG